MIRVPTRHRTLSGGRPKINPQGRRRSRRRESAGLLTVGRVAVLAGLAFLPAIPALALPEPLTLRVEDGEAVPGDVLAVVVRTYSPRGLSSGQICFRGTANLAPRSGDPPFGTATTGTSPLEALLGVEVFSEAGDAVFDAVFDPLSGETLLTFQSPSAGVNASDGPLAVLYFRLASTVASGTLFEIAIDLAATAVEDGDSQPVTVEPRAGRFEALVPSAAFDVGPEGDAAVPGQLADLGLTTSRFLPLDGGEILLRFDPGIAAADWADRLEVEVDPRHGTATATAETPAPGEIRILIHSPDLTWNSVPGQVVTIRLPIASDAPLGSVTAVELDPVQTFLRDAEGTLLDLSFDTEVIEIVPESPAFADGFESGDTLEWCLTVP
ncbi:MAG: hypothetical protein MI919_22180 [Holophagales bacterium]|nr:hypothetical protein [Holophagales bacterium]